ncbi:10 kda heat shock protein [Anaeramoeba ignava]|uniref:20 kDa chaperonin, chloroplastic n=1 Tax=Anaeramoeba ignava TaxID=1746090 RepID=A0A9Q0R8E1_ANAIG|nr:10 kda heat shock protein [Anaeramoeba ignava]
MLQNFKKQLNQFIPNLIFSTFSSTGKIDPKSIHPLFGWILVEREGKQEKTKEGIYIPESAKTKSQLGKVIAIGTGREDISGNTIPITTKVGAKVILPKFGGIQLKSVGDNYFLLHETDLVAEILSDF